MAEKLITRRSFTKLLFFSSLASIGLGLSGCSSEINQAPKVIQNNVDDPIKLNIAAEKAIDIDPLINVPDTHISFVKNADSITSFVTAEGKSYLFESRDLSNPIAKSSMDRLPVLYPGPKEDYAGFGSVVKFEDKLVGFFHREIDHNPPDKSPFDSSIARAESLDGGRTWVKTGDVILGKNAGRTPGKIRGAGQPSTVVNGDYLYMYYVDWNGLEPDGIHLARSPLSLEGKTGTWEKFRDGGFKTPQIDGVSDQVISRPSEERVNKYASHPSVSFNNYLNRFLALFETDVALYMTTSTNGIEWEGNQMVLQFPQPFTQRRTDDIYTRYYSFLSFDAPDHMTTTQNGYLYYCKNAYKPTRHHMFRRAITIS